MGNGRNLTKIMGVLMGLIMAIAVAGAYWYAHEMGKQCAERPQLMPSALASVRPLPDAELAPNGPVHIADVTARVMPSVVNVFATKKQSENAQRQGMPFLNDPFFRRFFGAPEAPPPERRERSLGSGVIVDNRGTILTNNHVVQGSGEIRVSFADQSDLEAELVGTDPQSDLAVLRLKKPPKNLAPLSFGDSSRLRLGDIVLAIGNPFGLGQTVTMGIVSAVGRANMGIVDYEDFIQTDAAINPGNSGGALVDLNGNLVGINTAILSRSGGYQGIGFAIPSNMASPVMKTLLEGGKVVRGWLGVAIQDLTPELRAALNLGSNQGVLVGDVVSGGPAEKAGLQKGDVIVQVDDEKVAASAKLRNLIAMRGPNVTVRLHLIRDQNPLVLSVTLETLATAAGHEPESGSAAPGMLGGMSVAPLNASTRRAFGIPPSLSVGVVIVNIAPGTPAQGAGLQPGDVIIEINRQAVTSVRQAMALYQQSEGRVLLWIQRGPARTFLVLPKR